jgi:hypothetical protein
MTIKNLKKHQLKLDAMDDLFVISHWSGSVRNLLLGHSTKDGKPDG